MLHMESKSSSQCWYKDNFINSAFDGVSGEVGADKGDSSSSKERNETPQPHV